MARLIGLELLDCIAKAESQGKSWEEQCLEADYVTHVGTPNTQAFSDAVDKAKRHLEIIGAGSLHPFLSHGYTKTPVSRQNKRLNQNIEEFSSLVSLSYIDRLEEGFMDNFDEIGNPDGEMYEYDFGVFDSQESAKQYVLGELDAGWWISYFEGEKNTVLKNSGFKNLKNPHKNRQKGIMQLNLFELQFCNTSPKCIALSVYLLKFNIQIYFLIFI